MLRRSLLAALATSVVAARAAQAHGVGANCGTAANDVEEEWLDLHGAASVEELAHFFSERLEVSADTRFSISDSGRLLTHGTLDGFRVRSANGASTDIPAAYGGTLIADPGLRAQALQLTTGSPYATLAVAGSNTQFEIWNDAFAISGVAWSARGLVLGHGEPDRVDGRLSLLNGVSPLVELARTERPPGPLLLDGSRVFYFVGERAFMLDLQQSRATPASWGALPEAPRAAVFAGGALLALTASGLFRLTPARSAVRILSEAGAETLFLAGKSIVVASPQRVWLLQGSRRQTVEAPNHNLHHVTRVADSDDLLLCRGPNVLRYRASSGVLERLGTGRTGYKLRGAALFDGRLLTWSTRTWRVVGPSCLGLTPAREFLID